MSQLSDYLMGHGVLKNADAEVMAGEIEEEFAKARDAALAKVAEMRWVLERLHRPHGKVPDRTCMVCDALSSDCGKGWLSPEKAKVLVDKLVEVTKKHGCACETDGWTLTKNGYIKEKCYWCQLKAFALAQARESGSDN